MTITDLGQQMESRRDELLTMLAFVESESHALAISSHLLARCRPASSPGADQPNNAR